MDSRSAPDLNDADALFAGVDGGGSTCRVRIRDGCGLWRAETVGGAANVYLDFDAAIATLSRTITDARARIGEAGRSLHLALGLAGVSSPLIADRVRQALGPLADTVVVTSDADTACVGAHAGQDGGLVVAGTGSSAVARLGSRSVALGGRGFILGDDGSGARLGLDAMRAALRAHDALESHTDLTQRLMARFANDPVQAIAWGRDARSSDFAALAPLVIEAAAAGDGFALHLVAGAVAALGGLGAALRRLGAPRLCFVGGLSAPLLPFFPPAVAAAFEPPRMDALDGALLLAGCPLTTAAPP